MRFEGVSGEVRCAGRRVVTLGMWVMDSNDRTIEHSIQAKFSDEPDEFWMGSDGPFELRLDFRDGIWRWQEVDIMWSDNSCWINCVGPQERQF